MKMKTLHIVALRIQEKAVLKRLQEVMFDRDPVFPGDVNPAQTDAQQQAPFHAVFRTSGEDDICGPIAWVRCEVSRSGLLPDSRHKQAESADCPTDSRQCYVESDEAVPLADFYAVVMTWPGLLCCSNGERGLVVESEHSARIQRTGRARRSGLQGTDRLE
jgi:hypothetical protein